MDARVDDLQLAKADFYLTIAQAFRVPAEKTFRRAFVTDLAADLHDLEQQIGYGETAAIDEFARRAAALGDADVLLPIYSRLFLQPPRRAHLNTSVYLDGILNGNSVREMEHWYRATGVAKSEAFKDLADHVVVQLEYVAHLYRARARGEPLPHTAGHFLARFVCRWVEPLRADVRVAASELGWPQEPYAPLLDLLRIAAAHDAEPLPAGDPAHARRERAMFVARHERAVRGITAADLELVRKKLAACGLASEHVQIPYHLRDEAYGWRSGIPPAPRAK